VIHKVLYTELTVLSYTKCYIQNYTHKLNIQISTSKFWSEKRKVIIENK